MKIKNESLESSKIWLGLARFNVIETQRLLLRPFVSTDSIFCYDFMKKWGNMRYVMLPCENMEACEWFIVDEMMKNPLGNWAIELKSEKKVIGFIHFSQLILTQKKAKIGYVIHQAYGHQGFMTEALQTIVAFSFEQFHLKSLELEIESENYFSQKLAEKFNFKRVKMSKLNHLGAIRQFYSYQLTKEDFFKYEKGESCPSTKKY